MDNQSEDDIRGAVRETYGRIADAGPIPGGCGCGSGASNPNADDVSAALGYSAEELQSVPEGANLGLGCGNPQAIAALKQGETVLDLGCGGGFDSFLAARQVGESGSVIGVDMTAEMVSRARVNATKVGLANVTFRLGEIEHLPVSDATVDVIISNCVINLSPDKAAVFREAFRVLKPGGRLAVEDIVATAPLPKEVRNDLALIAGCVAGAAEIDELTALIADAGFTNVEVKAADASRKIIREWIPGSDVADYILSASIEATKP